MRPAPTIENITVSNYRCFRGDQAARLAPLTLLVGENSTGKTSFLALVRALWDVAVKEAVPDFKEYPFDLGSFHEIAHYRGAKANRTDSFDAGLSYADNPLSFNVTFAERDGVPFPVTRRVVHGNDWIQLDQQEGQFSIASFGISNEQWELPYDLLVPSFGEELESIRSLHWRLSRSHHVIDPKYGIEEAYLQSLTDHGVYIEHVIEQLYRIGSQRPFSSAPVRSRPRRTYDPSRPTRDPEGGYTPTFLQGISRRKVQEWDLLKHRLETFGKASGLFDEIMLKSLGAEEGSPFQVQVRKYGRAQTVKGPARNMVDVGYGVSQALPILTEVLREDSPSVFLLQQPEVHLHPSAQAALGSLFCSIAATSMQLIVETHSDHLLDRVRMDVRDEKTELKAEEVSILFFEPGELDVTIHSLRLDENGNVLDAPPTYRQFFMNEMQRSLGL